jgi:hypothetical protein
LGSGSNNPNVKEITHEPSLAKRSFHEVNHEPHVQSSVSKTNDQVKKSNEGETGKETQIQKGAKSSKSKTNQKLKPIEAENQIVAQQSERKTSTITNDSQPRKDSVNQPVVQNEAKHENGSSKKVKENTNKQPQSNGHDNVLHKMATEPIVVVAENKPVDVVNHPNNEVANLHEEVKEAKKSSVKKPKKQNKEASEGQKAMENQETKAKKTPKPKKEKSANIIPQGTQQQPEKIEEVAQNEPAEVKLTTKKTEPKKTDQKGSIPVKQVSQPQNQTEEKKEAPKQQKEPKQQIPKSAPVSKSTQEAAKPVQQTQAKPVEQPKTKQNANVLAKSKTQQLKKHDSSDEEIFNGLMKQPKINPALSVTAQPPAEQVEIKNIGPSDDDENEIVNSFNVEVSSDDQNEDEDDGEQNFLDSDDEKELEDSDLEIQKKPVSKPSFVKKK